MTLPIILLGAGGHAKVVLDMLRQLKRSVLGVCDPTLDDIDATTWRGLPVLGDDSVVFTYRSTEVQLANGIGSLPDSNLRHYLHENFTAKGYHFSTLIHPMALIGDGVILGQGAQVMAGAIIQTDTQVGDNVIINTGARIDHDCRLGDHVHVAPGAILSGGVNVGDYCQIGAGAALIQNVTLGRTVIIGAGTTVLSDVPTGHLQTGQPPRQPRPLKKGSRSQ